MYELQDFIVNWMDNNNYPPTYSNLPSQLYLPGLFCNHVRLWLMRGEFQHREYGSLIYLQRKPVAQLVLGNVIDGKGSCVYLPGLYQQKYSLPGSCPLGAFHTHPSLHRAFSAPSLLDFSIAHELFKEYKSICNLVVSPPLENPWYYMIIVSKDTSLYEMDKTIFRACGKVIRRLQINTVTDSIKKEMSRYTNDPSVDQRICDQIGHDRTLSHVCTLYKAGFYSGQNGLLTMRNAIS